MVYQRHDLVIKWQFFGGQPEPETGAMMTVLLSQLLALIMKTGITRTFEDMWEEDTHATLHVNVERRIDEDKSRQLY